MEGETDSNKYLRGRRDWQRKGKIDRRVIGELMLRKRDMRGKWKAESEPSQVLHRIHGAKL